MEGDPINMLSTKLIPVVKKLGYTKLTKIQEDVIREIKRDPRGNLLVVAPTGYGKTEAVIFPILDHILNCGEKCKKGIQVLYITPLRSLNRDIFKRMVTLIKEELGIDISVRHSDTTTYERAKQSRKPPVFLITTPETLQSILMGSSIRKALANVKWVIIDEVHAILDSKRGVHLAIGLERLRYLSKNFSIIGVSATVGNKEEILRYITNGKGGKIIAIKDKKAYDVKIEFVAPKLTYSHATGSMMYKVDIYGIAKLILKYIKETPGKVLVFTNTRDLAEILGLILNKLTRIPIAVHHSSLSKDIRLKVENEFKTGDLKCVIATSSLELGIDIGEIDLVIQVMSPRRVETALQRIGRAGHKFSRISRGVIITGTIDDLFESIAISSLVNEGVVEPISLSELNLDVLAHQIIGIIREKYLEGERKADKNYVYEIIKATYPYKDLKREKFEKLLRFMEKHARLLRIEGNSLRLTRKSIRYYFENVSTIPTTVKYRVVDVSDNFKKVGELDTKFVLELNVGDHFILGGVPREVIEIDARKREVLVISTNIESKPPVWTGELLPVSKEVANKVGEIREYVVEGKVDDLYWLSQNSIKALKSAASLFSREKPVPTAKNMLIEFDPQNGIIVINSPYGNKINNAFSTLLAWFFMEDRNLPYINFENDAYRVIIRFESAYLISKDHIFNELESIINSMIDTAIIEGRLEEIISEAVLEFRLNEIAWYFVNVLKRFGLLRDESSLTKKHILKLISKYRDEVVVEEAVREFIQSKMDLKGLKDLLRSIDEGEINIWFVEGISPISLASNNLANVVIKDVEYLVERKYEERLLNREAKFICLTCGKTWIDKVANTPTKCDKCGSNRITAVRKWETLDEIVNKRIKGEPLSADEQRKYREMEAISRFISAYGYIAVYPIVATGIGIKQAIEILGKYAASKRTLLQEIRKREINYFKSRSIIEKKYI